MSTLSRHICLLHIVHGTLVGLFSTCRMCVCVLNRDSFDDLLPVPTSSRGAETDHSLSQQSAADGGEQWTAVNRR